MAWFQKEIELSPKRRGFHLVTREILDSCSEISQIDMGLLHLHLKHTSASLSLNENADPTVRQDFETYFNASIPDGSRQFIHQDEGPDDMPAHLKSSLLGVSLSLPISRGRLNLGMWQGIYLGEHRNHGGARRLLATIHGV